MYQGSFIGTLLRSRFSCATAGPELSFAHEVMHQRMRLMKRCVDCSCTEAATDVVTTLNCYGG